MRTIHLCPPTWTKCWTGGDSTLFEHSRTILLHSSHGPKLGPWLNKFQQRLIYFFHKNLNFVSIFYYTFNHINSKSVPVRTSNGLCMCTHFASLYPTAASHAVVKMMVASCKNVAPGFMLVLAPSDLLQGLHTEALRGTYLPLPLRPRFPSPRPAPRCGTGPRSSANAFSAA